MTTLDEQQRIIAEGRDAKALIQNPALNACMDATMTQLFADWMSSESPENREELHATARALSEFKHTIDAFISTGALEERNRKDEQSYNK